MSRKKRSDSIEAMVTAASGKKEIEPPAHIKLRDIDWPFWYSITKARISNFWTDADLELAANLARCKGDIERLQDECDITPYTYQTPTGTEKIHPTHDLLEKKIRLAVSLSRALHVHAEATGGKSRTERNANTAAPERTQAQGDDLLAKPRH